MKPALIIFVREPEQGKVKTRLAKTMGDIHALAIYKKMLLHTRNIVLDLDADKYVFYSEQLKPDHFPVWTERVNDFSIEIQQGEELGEKMKHAFTFLFQKGYNKVCIIGSDCMSLCSSDLEEAFLRLEQDDIVIGPALDGGYYLLGMKEMYASVFADKEWSTDNVLKNTIHDIELSGYTYYLLRPQSDIDIEEDWVQHLAEKK